MLISYSAAGESRNYGGGAAETAGRPRVPFFAFPQTLNSPCGGVLVILVLGEALPVGGAGGNNFNIHRLGMPMDGRSGGYAPL